MLFTDRHVHEHDAAIPGEVVMRPAARCFTQYTKDEMRKTVCRSRFASLSPHWWSSIQKCNTAQGQAQTQTQIPFLPQHAFFSFQYVH